MRAFYLFFTVVALALAGCGSFLPTDEAALEEDAGGAFTRVHDGGDLDASLKSDALLAASTGSCVHGAMVRVGLAGSEFCIDATEVTNAAYQQFLDANPSPTFRPECTWKTTHAWSLPAGSSYEPGTPELPVVGVDWCDADAYCAWAGKKLCSRDRWSTACSGGGVRRYPFGDKLDVNACNLSSVKEPVRSRVTCQGSYEGVFDLFGNVDEWGDTPFAPGFDDARTDQTRTLGGGDCVSEGASTARAYRSDEIGFRCCADD